MKSQDLAQEGHTRTHAPRDESMHCPLRLLGASMDDAQVVIIPAAYGPHVLYRTARPSLKWSAVVHISLIPGRQ
jgi:hypothetical protein